MSLCVGQHRGLFAGRSRSLCVRGMLILADSTTVLWWVCRPTPVVELGRGSACASHEQLPNGNSRLFDCVGMQELRGWRCCPCKPPTGTSLIPWTGSQSSSRLEQQQLETGLARSAQLAPWPPLLALAVPRVLLKGRRHRQGAPAPLASRRVRLAGMGQCWECCLPYLITIVAFKERGGCRRKGV